MQATEDSETSTLQARQALAVCAEGRREQLDLRDSAEFQLRLAGGTEMDSIVSLPVRPGRPCSLLSFHPSEWWETGSHGSAISPAYHSLDPPIREE